MQSITVSTRLRSADSPATWWAARGTGINVSSSTNGFDRGGLQRDALASDGHDQQKLVHLLFPPSGRLERHQQARAVEPVDAVVLLVLRLRLGAQVDRVRSAGLVTLGSDDQVCLALFLVTDHAVARGFDDRAKHVLHPRIV